MPNRFKKQGQISHLKSKVDIPKRFASNKDASEQLNRDMVFLRLCPPKNLTIELEPLKAEDQNVPGWGGFNAILNFTNQAKGKTTIGYNPVVPGLPNNHDMLYTGLKNIERQVATLGQTTPAITLDLQLYIIAQEIRFNNWEELNHFVIRMVGFHIMELYWKILGKRYAESGLDDLLIEAGVFGKNATSIIMQGKHYKQCMLAHKLMFEVMCRLQWQAFFKWIVQQGRMQQQDSEEIDNIVSKFRKK